jgi:hypothetical protein
MKRFILIISLLVAFVSLQAQQGRIYSITVDTVKSNETIYLTTPQISGGYETLALQVLCTQKGGTTDGKVTIQASADGISYKGLTDNAAYFYGIGNDTLTMTNGVVGEWIVLDTPWNFYRFKVEGTASDTTIMTAKFIYK